MTARTLAAPLLAVTALAASLSGCVAPVGPVEVTRFHLPDTTMLGRGQIVVVAAPGEDAGSIEGRTYRAEVARRLVLLGYAEAAAGASAPQIAEVRVSRETWRPERSSSPVSVGVGGSTGSYGSGVGVGIGLNLSGRPPAQTRTDLSVRIRDRLSGQALWEGRASFTVRADSPMAQTSLGAAKMTEALFKGFPGQSGATITVE